MSRELPPCDHDECPPTHCKRPVHSLDRIVVDLLESLPHDCDEYTTQCFKNCEACLAQHLLHEMRQQDNAKGEPQP